MRRRLNLTNSHDFVTARRAKPELVYEYHPLLREFLLSRAREGFSEATYTELHRKAANLLEANGQVEDAVAVLLELEDWKALNRIIRAHAVRACHHRLALYLGLEPAHAGRALRGHLLHVERAFPRARSRSSNACARSHNRPRCRRWR